MGFLDAIQSLFNGAGGSIGDVVGGIAADVPGLQDLQDQVSSVTDGVSEAATSATEAVPTAIEDITNNIGL